MEDPNGIKELRKEHGWSQRELARRAGVPYQRVQSLEKPTEKGHRSNSRYLDAVVAALKEGSNGKHGPQMVYRPIPKLDMGASIPVYDLKSTADGGLEMLGLVVNSVKRPEGLEHVDEAYGVQMRDMSMYPRYFPGERLIVNPRLAPRPQDGVLLVSDDRHAVEVGEFVSDTGTEWTVKKYGDKPHSERIKKADFPTCHCIFAVFKAV